MSSKFFFRINTRLYPGGHPSSYYNPIQPGLTWNPVVKGNTLTTSAIRAPNKMQLLYNNSTHMSSKFENQHKTIKS